MTDPLTALIVSFIGLFVLGVIYWPGKGLVARWKRAAANTKRVLIEDALKHLYDCEYKNTQCSLHSIAGSLAISGDRAAGLLSRLESMGLIRTSDKILQLTEVGRSYALRVIRVHRIWERYLADETGTTETEWHTEADLQEHQMSFEEANQLAAQIGNPVYDPHGDPIPSAKGEIPAYSGQPLNTLKKGEIARIIHLEDEPNTIYSQLIAQGLYPGMQIRMLDTSEEKVRFIADGEECVLAPVFAANVTVRPVQERESLQKSFETLSSLSVGQSAEVAGISAALRGKQRRRLMDFGIVPGTIISVEMRSPGGDPTAYQILGATIALRKDHADCVYIKGSNKTHKK